jgi:hypothetical protein
MSRLNGLCHAYVTPKWAVSRLCHVFRSHPSAASPEYSRREGNVTCHTPYREESPLSHSLCSIHSPPERDGYSLRSYPPVPSCLHQGDRDGARSAREIEIYQNQTMTVGPIQAAPCSHPLATQTSGWPLESSSLVSGGAKSPWSSSGLHSIKRDNQTRGIVPCLSGSGLEQSNLSPGVHR